jgi:predicted transcriptional regulator
MTTTKSKPPRTDPVADVQASEKFQSWGKLSLRDLAESTIMVDEKHYTPSELAQMWGVSVQTIRELFKNEEGVLKIGRNGTRMRRAYKTLRIPHSIAERVHTRLSA